MSDPFDMDEFVNTTSDRLREKNRKPPVDTFQRALERVAKDSNDRDRIERATHPKQNFVPEDAPTPGIVLPPARRKR